MQGLLELWIDHRWCMDVHESRVHSGFGSMIGTGKWWLHACKCSCFLFPYIYLVGKRNQTDVCCFFLKIVVKESAIWVRCTVPFSEENENQRLKNTRKMKWTCPLKKDNPWTPTTHGKMQVLHPQNMGYKVITVITPKKWRKCGFPWNVFLEIHLPRIMYSGGC